MDQLKPQRKYTAEEKQQLLENLDIELAHRTRRLEGELADALQKFLIRQESQILRIPPLVRALSLREFRDKYNGDITSALKGLRMEKLGVTGADEDTFEIDKSTRKRKWVASMEVDSNGHVADDSRSGALEVGSSRASKNARVMQMSPKKNPRPMTGPATARLPNASTSRTPIASRTTGRPFPAASPSPRKQMSNPSTFHRPPLSPTKPAAATQAPNRVRPPSTNTFAPVLPKEVTQFTARLPRRDEGLLSLNGSPVANPYQFGLGWFAAVASGEGDPVDDGRDTTAGGRFPAAANGKSGVKRTKNKINVRRDPSITVPSHSRSASQSSLAPSTTSTLHSRTNSLQITPAPLASLVPLLSTDSSTPKAIPVPSSHATQIAALVSLPTSDGHLLEFDPLQTSPEQLDELNITDSAKKGAREEMGRLIMLAVERWKLT